MTEEEFLELAKVIRPRMLEEVKMYRGKAHGRLTEADEEEIVNDSITALHRRMADLPEDDKDIWKRFMAQMYFKFLDFLRRYGETTLSLSYRPFPDALSLGETIPSTKYQPDRVVEQAEKESNLERLLSLMREVPLQPNYRRVVNLCYLDSPETLNPSGSVADGRLDEVVKMENLPSKHAAKHLLWRARGALRKAVISRLQETKDPLLDLVLNGGFLADRSGEL